MKQLCSSPTFANNRVLLAQLVLLDPPEIVVHQEHPEPMVRKDKTEIQGLLDETEFLVPLD